MLKSRIQCRRYSRLLPLIPLLFILISISACQGNPVAQAAVAPVVKQSTQPLEQAASRPPVISTRPLPSPTLPPPAEMPAFSPLDPEDLAATEAAILPTTPAPTASPTATSTATATPTETATPQPTYTPPSLPLTSPDEHYWLRRPIPDGGTVWTDKSYPYGTTQGGTLRPHHGVEFYVPSGTEILAAASGTVRVAGDDLVLAQGPHTNFYGNLIVIELDSRWQGQPVYNLYGHLSELVVTEGEHVDAQQVIAYSGASGVADGPHLHFEVRLGQNSYHATRNPLLWLYPFRDFGSVAGRVLWPNGQPVEEAPVRVRRIDAESRYLATTTYSGTDVHGDNVWQENFALDDVPVGYYEVIVDTGEKTYKQEVWVFPFRTSFVEFVLDG